MQGWCIGICKRLLSLRSVTKVHSQAHQSKAQVTRRVVAQGLEVVTGASDEVEDISSVDMYFGELERLMVAYAIGGVEPVATPIWAWHLPCNVMTTCTS